MRDAFIFRYALTAYVLILRAVRTGGVKINQEKLQNDMIDMNFVTFATYFDGLMTDDAVAREIYTDAAFLLGEVYAASCRRCSSVALFSPHMVLRLAKPYRAVPTAT